MPLIREQRSGHTARLSLYGAALKSVGRSKFMVGYLPLFGHIPSPSSAVPMRLLPSTCVLLYILSIVTVGASTALPSPHLFTVLVPRFNKEQTPRDEALVLYYSRRAFSLPAPSCSRTAPSAQTNSLIARRRPSPWTRAVRY